MKHLTENVWAILSLRFCPQPTLLQVVRTSPVSLAALSMGCHSLWSTRVLSWSWQVPALPWPAAGPTGLPGEENLGRAPEGSFPSCHPLQRCSQEKNCFSDLLENHILIRWNTLAVLERPGKPNFWMYVPALEDHSPSPPSPSKSNLPISECTMISMVTGVTNICLMVIFFFFPFSTKSKRGERGIHDSSG